MIEKTKYKSLFTPLKIGKIEIKNRICCAPMGTGYSSNNTGALSPVDEEFYVARAKGGAGLLFTGATRMDTIVDKIGMGSYGTFNIGYAPLLYKQRANRMLERIHSYGAKMFAQITMGNGRNHGEKSPSPVADYYNPDKICDVLTDEEIRIKIKEFAQAALIAKQSGFDGVEVHAMHFGYLMDEFAMEIFNHRQPPYGGSFENRMRCAKELLEEVKKTCGDNFPVSMRLGLKSYIKGFHQPSIDGSDEAGRTLEEGVQIGKYLESIGYDLLSVDSGVYDSFYYCYPPMYLPMGVNIDLAAALKKEVNIPVIVCGRMHDVDLCEKTVADGMADGVVIGRQMLADPDFAIKAKLNKAEDIRPCLSCNFGCRGRMANKLELSCAVNPLVRKESAYPITPATVKKSVMVIGAGIAGMEAARVAAMRGHKVHVYEKSDKIGGIFNYAAMPEFKEEDRKLIRWYGRQLEKLDVEVTLNKTVDLEFVLSEAPDVVISATGSTPIMPNLPGIDHPKALCFTDALSNMADAGDSIVVVGGGLVGCEVALNFTRMGRKVTMVEYLGDILSSGAPTPFMNKMYLKDAFAHTGVEVLTSTKLIGVNDVGAVIERSGNTETIPADSVIIAVGLKSRLGFSSQLADYGIEVYSIGDEREVANIYNSVWNGFEVGRAI